MVTAIIFRELQTLPTGKRGHAYTFAVNDRLDSTTYYSLAAVRKAAALRLKHYPHSNLIVEDWPDGKRLRATTRGNTKPATE